MNPSPSPNPQPEPPTRTLEHLTSKVVNESLFANVAMGFVDTSPALRELTVKSMVTLAPKLKPASMQQVMRA